MNTLVAASDSRSASRPDAAEESDDPRNALLDAFEAMVEALKDNGFEAQMRARLARLLPPLEPETPPAPAATFAEFPAAENELQLSILIGDLKRIAKLKMTEHSHDAAKRVRTWAEAQLATSKEARR